MIKPNFFIVGAPKCGTTSLAHWLAGHPQVFMSPVKEPHFFNTDYQRYLNSLKVTSAFLTAPSGVTLRWVKLRSGI